GRRDPGGADRVGGEVPARRRGQGEASRRGGWLEVTWEKERPRSRRCRCLVNLDASGPGSSIVLPVAVVKGIVLGSASRDRSYILGGRRGGPYYSVPHPHGRAPRTCPGPPRRPFRGEADTAR